MCNCFALLSFTVLIPQVVLISKAKMHFRTIKGNKLISCIFVTQYVRSNILNTIFTLFVKQKHSENKYDW